jgi:DNA-binding transcriptional MerR regulator
MALKMKDLVAQTGESKSTILYYLKEGLLPEPQKPKPNVHLYDESCVARIRLIKYLQEHFSYSIAQIKHIFKHNRFDFDASFESIIRAVELLAGDDGRTYDKETFLELVELDEASLSRYEARGYILPRGGRYGQKEREAVEILKRAEAAGVDFALFDAYVDAARRLAELENKIGAEVLADESVSHNERYALLFDILLRFKPYVFNRHTVAAHQAALGDETEEV